ncbi:DUF2784 domain-containing protein [Phenylobacterium sp.]|jgi:hypothetical protein|uniref:DUF2784 domain-containing protein n=1 Tax=Phenylobacterium sp. TaxID=1871053 RepID=UPI002F94DEF2
MSSAVLGQLVLGLHLVVIAFNVLGLAAVPLGASLGWDWVRIRWWRALHVLSWVVVAVQAVLGRACFLTYWQDDLTGGGAEDPLIMRWVNSVIYWELPMWAFTAIYVALFGLVLALWKLVPPERRAPA